MRGIQDWLLEAGRESSGVDCLECEQALIDRGGGVRYSGAMYVALRGVSPESAQDDRSARVVAPLRCKPLSYRDPDLYWRQSDVGHALRR
jgi:hypothetical protein